MIKWPFLSLGTKQSLGYDEEIILYFIPRDTVRRFNIRSSLPKIEKSLIFQGMNDIFWHYANHM